MSDVNETSHALPVAGSVLSTGTPATLPQLDTGHQIRELLLQADPANTDNVLIGNAVAQVIVLQAGDTFSLALQNPAECSHKSASGNQRLNYLGRD